MIASLKICRFSSPFAGQRLGSRFCPRPLRLFGRGATLTSGLLVFTLVAAAQTRTLAEASPTSYGDVLAAVVNERGMVDYAALAREAGFRRAVAAQAEALAGDRSDGAELAELINVHNAAVLHLLVEAGAGAGEGGSILDLEEGAVFDRPRVRLATQTVSLNELTKKHIAPLAGDERYHYALVCGAVSCPPLRAEAYSVSGLQAQLDEQRDRVLKSGDSRFVQWEGNGKVRAMKLLEWYASEFGDPATYLNRHANLPGKATAVSFLDYDWALNAQR